MKSTRQSPLFLVCEILLLIIVVFGILFPYSPISHGVPSRDSGVFLYAGWRVLRGDIPYLQFWDHKPPIIYYLDALGLLLTPNTLWGVWGIEFASMGVATTAGYYLMKRLYGLNSAILSMFLWLFSSFTILAGGNLTTEYGLPFQFLLLLIFQHAETKKTYGWSGFLIGLFSAILFFIRQNAIGIPLAIVFYLLIDRAYHREFRRLYENLLPVAAGGIIVSAIVVGYFAAKGALQPFWDTAFQYNFFYSEERGTVDRFYALAQGLNQLANVGLAQLGLLGWGAALILLIFKKDRIPKPLRSFFWMMMIALPVELWMVSIGGRPRIPYFLALLPVFSIFAGFTFWLIFEILTTGLPNYVGAIFVVFISLVLGVVFYADYAELTGNFLTWAKDPPIVTYISENSKPDDYLLMWGAETAYNFVTRRASPTRFVYQTPLYSEQDKTIVSEFLNDILIKKPRLIILKSDDRLTDRRFGYRDNQISDLMTEVKNMYQGPISIDDWLVYVHSQ